MSPTDGDSVVVVAQAIAWMDGEAKMTKAAKKDNSRLLFKIQQ